MDPAFLTTMSSSFVKGCPMRGTLHAPYLAVLHDADNVSLGCIPLIKDAIKAYGEAIYRVYGDLNQPPLKTWCARIGHFNIQGIQQDRTERNATDKRLMNDGYSLLAVGKISTFILVSGDADYLPFCINVQQQGKHVIVIGHRGHTSSDFVQAGIKVIYVEDPR